MPGLFDGTPLERPVTCATCGEAIQQCRCAKGADGKAIDPTKLAPRVRREKRCGKWCTVVAEHGLNQDGAKSLLKELRTTLGTGGGLGDTDAAGVQIVLQGDHRDAVVRALIDKGFRAKAAGG